ncbi:MAG: hypothetical protein M1837_002063 [Sclerophora amabilis]|nr:MAG: hypothetical protein M1837_002063 [Sclerophora amabilis]
MKKADLLEIIHLVHLYHYDSGQVENIVWEDWMVGECVDEILADHWHVNQKSPYAGILEETPSVPKTLVGKLKEDCGEPRLKMAQRKRDERLTGIPIDPAPIPPARRKGANVYLQMLQNKILPAFQLQDQACCSVSPSNMQLDGRRNLEDEYVRMVLNWDHHHQEHVRRYNKASVTYACRYALWSIHKQDPQQIAIADEKEKPAVATFNDLLKPNCKSAQSISFTNRLQNAMVDRGVAVVGTVLHRAA